MTVETQVLWGLGVFAGLLLLIMLRKLLVKAVRLLLRTAAGAGVLALLAQTSGALGIQLGVNLYNALPLGEGTERLGERLSVLAGRPVLRLDRDSTRRPGRMEEILAAFARQESPILVGTQMLSKGHHFPQVTLAVVADGDLGLNLPDYRAAERTFQLLVQSAGRAGRGEKPGRVLIQTRDVSHYCWQYVQTGDYEGFYAAELARRRLRQYPPFVRLALIRMSFGVEEKDGPAALNELTAALRLRARELDVRMLGPAPAPLALLRGRRRFHCLLKAGDWQVLRQLYFFAKSRKAAAPLRLFLDLDPVNML